MSKPPHPPRRRHLSKEDEALWEHTAASLKPLRERKGRHHPGVAGASDAPPFAPKAKGGRKAGSGAQHSTAKDAAQPQPAPPAKPRAPGLADFDRKAARRLRQGQIEIEARIDLHGMRQHEAHGALRRFLLSCFGRGVRWVLVITGKGGPRKTQDDEGWSLPERGVLRKNVPLWLAEPELRAIVVSFTTAAVPHGGEGALYIQLRNPGRARS
jgi:DNA-nicking Smr family endonuclease